MRRGHLLLLLLLVVAFNLRISAESSIACVGHWAKVLIGTLDFLWGIFVIIALLFQLTGRQIMMVRLYLVLAADFGLVVGARSHLRAIVIAV